MKKELVGVLSTLVGLAIGASVIGCSKNKEIKKEKDITNRFKSYYNMLNHWIMLKNEGKTLSDYLLDNKYKNVAIYGMGEIGARLYEELRNTGVEVKYCIDKNYDGIYSELKVCSLEDKLEEVDVIIVTPIYNFQEVSDKISEVVDYNIISLEDFIYDL